jgi:hypothetical protein
MRNAGWKGYSGKLASGQMHAKKCFRNTADVDFRFVIFLVIGTLSAAIANVVDSDGSST